MNINVIQIPESRVETRSPYLITGPAQICVSGGRSSGFMLHELLEANGGLPSDCFATFQNTGKELNQSLDFVGELSHRFSVPITWLEWDGFIEPGRDKCNFKIVDRATAATSGEPFARLIAAYGYLPNPTQRLCTANLKTKVGAAYMNSLGFKQWDNILGIRADEPRRVARHRTPNRDNGGGESVLPLAVAGVTKRVVGQFWERASFDLQLINNNGTTPKGNCDLCFLKNKNQVLSLIRENPAAADWWIDQERSIAQRGDANTNCSHFRIDRPSYAQMKAFAESTDDMFPYDDEPLIDCMCGD